MLTVKTTLSGGGMGTGVAVMNFDGVVENLTELDDLLEAVAGFWGNSSTVFPSGVTMAVSNLVEVRENTSGDIIAIEAGTAQVPNPGTGGALAFAAGVGGRVRWLTAGVRNSRKVVGTTFMIPLCVDRFETNGTLTAAAITTMQNAGTTLIGAANGIGAPLAVWSRESAAGAEDGVLHPVTGVAVPDQSAWLTSRRT